MKNKLLYVVIIFAIIGFLIFNKTSLPQGRERILINDGWSFYKYADNEIPDNLIYDVRPETDKDVKDNRDGDEMPTEAVDLISESLVLKPWVLPTGNSFIKDKSRHYKRPEGSPGKNFEFVADYFDDSLWEKIDLPHDWAIKGPFYKGWGEDAPVGGGMGRLPIQGVAWYRKKIDIPSSDEGRQIYLDIDGAMSYSIVWINGEIAGGWPYGYNSYRVDLTPYIKFGKENQLAIRLDNPLNSARWYPGAGIYRNVWIEKTEAIHISQWGTFIKTPYVSEDLAKVEISINIDNKSNKNQKAEITTKIYEIDKDGNKAFESVSNAITKNIVLNSDNENVINQLLEVSYPKLWGPKPQQTPNMYVAVTELKIDNKIYDLYETSFGIRKVVFDPENGMFINGEKIYIKGVNQHHDLGSLGAAFNVVAAKRQLDILAEMGCNAIRMAHNPPAKELLDLTDKMGFIVYTELFDSWERKKPPLDFHLIFPDWSEQDIRAMLRRDRNHPSVLMWGYGNEVGEQYTDNEGAVVAKRLYDIIAEEDPTRPATTSMNYAKPHMPFSSIPDIISLNYQGEGIRCDVAYKGINGITTLPQYSAFKNKHPLKPILSSENAATVSSRGEYFFPVYDGLSAPMRTPGAGDNQTCQVSSYDLYTTDFGSSPDKVFAAEDSNKYVLGGFVWSGFDYLGEPSPYYDARSSYFGIVDLAGFPKDRYYLYQSRWRPDLPMVHILPHWNWQDRVGKITPIHIYTSGDEAELFLNGKSLGRKKKSNYEYRLRWDNVVYESGTVTAVAYKNGMKWAEKSVSTTGPATSISLISEKDVVKADGEDLIFIRAMVMDNNNQIVPNAKNSITFSVDGPGLLVSTDNGDAASLVSFASSVKDSYNGLCLAIIKPVKGAEGEIKVTATSENLHSGDVNIKIDNTPER